MNLFNELLLIDASQRRKIFDIALSVGFSSKAPELTAGDSVCVA